MAFIDSDWCTSSFKNHAGRFFVSIYTHDCPSSDHGCTKNFGFIHVVSSTPGVQTTDDLINKLTVLNTPGLSGERPFSTMSGTYQDPFDGSTIVYDAAAHQRDSDRWGIEKINGKRTGDLSDRERAEGEVWKLPGKPPIEAKRDKGIITIHNNRLGTDLTLDFSNVDHPSYPGH